MYSVGDDMRFSGDAVGGANRWCGTREAFHCCRSRVPETFLTCYRHLLRLALNSGVRKLLPRNERLAVLDDFFAVTSSDGFLTSTEMQAAAVQMD